MTLRQIHKQAGATYTDSLIGFAVSCLVPVILFLVAIMGGQ